MMRTLSTLTAATAVAVLPSTGITGALARPDGGFGGKKGEHDFDKMEKFGKKGDFDKMQKLGKKDFDKMQKFGKKGDFGAQLQAQGFSLDALLEGKEALMAKKGPMGKKPPMAKNGPSPKGRPGAKGGFGGVPAVKGGFEGFPAVKGGFDAKGAHGKKGGPDHHLGFVIKALCAEDETCATEIKAAGEKCKALADETEKKACHEKLKTDIEARLQAKGVGIEELKKRGHKGKHAPHHLGCVIKAVCAEDETCASEIKAEFQVCKAMADVTEQKACHGKVKADIDTRAQAKGIDTEELKKKCGHHGHHGKGGPRHLECVIKAVCAEDEACVIEIKAEAETCKAMTDVTEQKACHDKVKADIDTRAQAKGIDTEELKKKCNHNGKMGPHGKGGKMGPHGKGDKMGPHGKGDKMHPHGKKGPHHPDVALKFICGADEACAAELAAAGEKCIAVADETEKEACLKSLKASAESRLKAKGMTVEDLKKAHREHGKVPEHLVASALKALCGADEGCASEIKAAGEECGGATDETEEKSCFQALKADFDARLKAKGLSLKQAEAMAVEAKKDLRGRDRMPSKKVKQTRIGLKTTASIKLARSTTSADLEKDEEVKNVVKSAIAASLSVLPGDVSITAIKLKSAAVPEGAINVVTNVNEADVASEAADKAQGSLLTSNLRGLNTDESEADTNTKIAQQLEVDYTVTTEQLCDTTGANCAEDAKKKAIEHQLKDEKALAKTLETNLENAVAASPSVAEKMEVEKVNSASATDVATTVTVDVEVCVSGEFSMTYQCYPCPLGTFSNATGISVNTCTPCAEGLSTREVGSTVVSQCTERAAALHLNSGAFAQNSALVVVSFVVALLPIAAGFF